MKRKLLQRISFGLVGLALIVTSPVKARDADGWKSLLDGESLKGWTQRNGTAEYRLENGEVVGTTKSGIPVHEPDVEALRSAIETAADDVLRARLAVGTEKLRAERSWQTVVEGYDGLLRL